MADKPFNLVLEHLCYIREAVEALREDMCKVKMQLGWVEINLAHVQVAIAEQSVLLDRVDARTDRNAP